MGPLIWLFQFLYFFQYQAAAASFSSSSPPSFSSSTHLFCHRDQRSALLQFKHMFTINNFSSVFCDAKGIPSYPKTLYWNEDNATDCCYWDGVTCDRSTGHVIGIDLSCSQLYGTIHPNSSLFQLSHLQKLNLAYNDFNGSPISYAFGRFASLTHLNLSNSLFLGSISSEISHLSKLISLDLTSDVSYAFDDRRLRIEPSPLRMLLKNLTRVQELYLRRISVSSVLPNSMTNISSLMALDLSSTELQGNFPDGIFHLPNLQSLSLAFNNDIIVNLPKVTWGSNSSLQELNLSGTKLFGELPDSYFNNHLEEKIPDVFVELIMLESLYLNENNIEGPIPSTLCGLQNLRRLGLNNNALNGTIPSCLFNLPSLVYVTLSGNRITGQIPEFRHDSLLEEIDLSYNKLHGPIPPSISTLVNLTSLFLASNDLSGFVNLQKLKNLEALSLSNTKFSIFTSSNSNITMPNLGYFDMSSCKIKEFPDFLRTSKNLYHLDLSDNKINGQIPDWAGFMWKTSLSYLNLSHNFLTHIKQFSWENLQIFDLHSNLLRGPLLVPSFHIRYFFISNNGLSGEIPLLICNASSIEILDLSQNNLSGEIPQCLGNSSSALSVLDLHLNRFQGSIRLMFAKHNNLRNLDLNGNQLEGPLPRSLINCSRLEVLNVGKNKMNDTFPNWLETLPELQVLVLHSNKFHGPVDTLTSKSPFSKLRIVDLSNNEFNGHLPVRYFKHLSAMKNDTMPDKKYMGDGSYYHDSVTVTMKGLVVELVRIFTIFTTIDFSSNNFSGEIPKGIGGLDSLRQLNLSHNSLSGHISESLGNLKNLESLDLSSNKLSGKIPTQLTKLTFLEILNLSWNNLHGLIPRGSQFNTFGTSSYDGNSGLCGFPLLKECGNNHTQVQPPPELQKSEDDSDFDGFTWKIVMIGYECGLPLGLFLGFLMFLFGRPKVIVSLFEGKKHAKVIRLRRTDRRN